MALHSRKKEFKKIQPPYISKETFLSYQFWNAVFQTYFLKKILYYFFFRSWQTKWTGKNKPQWHKKRLKYMCYMVTFSAAKLAEKSLFAA